MPKLLRSTAKARVLSSREVYRGPVFWVTSDEVIEPAGVRVRRDLRQGKAQPEEDEVIQLRFLPVNQAVNWVLRGTIRDAKTIASILWLKQSRIGPKAAQKARSK